MPYQTPCPHCSRIGLVRVEHVIKAGSATKAYYCGACDFGWDIPDQPVVPPPASAKPKSRRFRSKLDTRD